MRAIKWSDDDRYLGPFTLSRNETYRYTGIILVSGDGDEYAGEHSDEVLREAGFSADEIARLRAQKVI